MVSDFVRCVGVGDSLSFLVLNHRGNKREGPLRSVCRVEVMSLLHAVQKGYLSVAL